MTTPLPPSPTELSNSVILSNSSLEQLYLEDAAYEAERYDFLSLVTMFLIFVMLGSFFLFLNCAMSTSIVAALSAFIRRGRCNSSCVYLLCPHWMIGIVFPVGIGWSIGRVPGALIISFLFVGIPCGFKIYHWRELDDVDKDDGCLVCPCCMSRTQEEATVDIEAPANAEIERTARAETLSRTNNGNSKRSALEQLLIMKSVVEPEKKKKRNKGAGRTNGTDVSFRTSHPKTDICPSGATNASTKHQQPSSSSMLTSIRRRIFPAESSDSAESKEDSTSVSTRLCTICLEEYKVGESIGWSRNPNCYHAFHKDCIFDWLMTHDDCPICRSEYTA